MTPISSRKRGYYRDFRVQVYATNDSDEELFLVDGGLTDWTARLLNDRKEICMTSGMGTERFISAFGRVEPRS